MQYHDALQRLSGAEGTPGHDAAVLPEARARFPSRFDHFTPAALPDAVRQTCAEGLGCNDSLKAARDREMPAAYVAESGGPGHR